MTTNVLTITDKGLAASANASAGGFLINVTTFQIGEGTVTPNQSDSSLSGASKFTSSISLVEVLSSGVVRFTLDLPPGNDSYPINEVAVYLDSGEMFARGVFSDPVTKDATVGIRIFCVITATNCNLTTINATLGDLLSIPCVASVATLPAPNLSNYNTIAVMDLKYNFDNTTSGSVAVKYGDGGLMWSFLGYSRIYFGPPDAIQGSTLNTSSFAIASLIASVKTAFVNNELIIVQIVSGTGQGESRRFKFNTATSQFNEIDGVPLTAIDGTSNLAIWRATESNNIVANPNESCVWPPSLNNVPPGWILTTSSVKNSTTGVVSSGCPIWVSPATLNSTFTSGLFENPSNITPNYVYFTGNGSTVTFDTGINPLSMTYTLIAIDGITQHKDAYDVQGSFVIFSEAPPPSTLIEVIVFVDVYSLNKISTSLTFLTDSTSIIPDGTTQTFLLNPLINETTLPPDATYLMVYITGIKQSLNAFLYKPSDSNNGNVPTITFNEPPAPGLSIQITYILPVQTSENTTQIHVNTFLGTGQSEIFNLAVTPYDYQYIFVYVSGVLMHSDTYSLSGNQLIITDPIQEYLGINVVIFQNAPSGGAPIDQLSGIVTGAIVTNKYLTLLRYNAPDFQIPNPRLNLIGGTGIQVIGNYPNYVIASNASNSIQTLQCQRFSNIYSQDNVEEIVYTYTFIYTFDTIVTVTADFSMRLGPGFQSSSGSEYIEYVLGFRTLSVNEPPYGRRVKGTGSAGFTHLPNGLTAFANASVTQSYEFDLTNTQSETVTFVARMHIVNGNVSTYKSQADVTFSLTSMPKTLQITN